MATSERTKPRMHKTNNNLESNAKSVAMELLNARLADSIDLALTVKQAHWNLKGPQFIGIHLMLDTFRTDQDEWVDTMAERITQLEQLVHDREADLEQLRQPVGRAAIH